MDGRLLIGDVVGGDGVGDGVGDGAGSEGRVIATGHHWQELSG